MVALGSGSRVKVVVLSLIVAAITLVMWLMDDGALWRACKEILQSGISLRAEAFLDPSTPHSSSHTGTTPSRSSRFTAAPSLAPMQAQDDHVPQPSGEQLSKYAPAAFPPGATSNPPFQPRHPGHVHNATTPDPDTPLLSLMMRHRMREDLWLACSMGNINDDCNQPFHAPLNILDSTRARAQSGN
jgi:hypothetical protein